ncbi:hypothetical protein J4411_00445 [Candidatus Pacearchaeota archaeon]|nr:hypothetical protein [uncultured archaeon]MBS3084367.1 hypothetical protein [Candidatus Pacearchaeota archaeon]
MRKIIRNKKGFLLASEVLKIVLAVISITFLIYLLFSIYYANINAQKKEEAESTLKRIGDIITRINNGAIMREMMNDITPVSWSFFSFVESEKKPNLCAGEDCMCICDSVNFDNFLFWSDRQINECDGNGICLTVKNLNKFESFKIKSADDGGTNIEVSKDGKSIEVKEA